MASDQAFDKAKWHSDSVDELGLPEDRAFVHTGFFVAWCALNGFWNDEYDASEILDAMRERRAEPIALYEWHDGCFFPSMLNEPARAFARRYFDLQTGRYLADYEANLALGLETPYHVPNEWASYDRIAPLIDGRFAEFRLEGLETPPK